MNAVSFEENKIPCTNLTNKCVDFHDVVYKNVPSMPTSNEGLRAIQNKISEGPLDLVTTTMEHDGLDEHCADDDQEISDDEVVGDENNYHQNTCKEGYKY